jgi:signal transduction histidine kinase
MESQTSPQPPLVHEGRILVVDDNRMNRIKLAHILQELGHTVVLAADGNEALHLLRQNADDQRFDVVLLDLLMPELDGFQVLETIKSDQTLRDLVVIVISALDEMESIVRCIELGAEDFLPKPFEPVILRARLKTSLERKKMRDLERAYLQQELMLRQSEKLATLGRLSAGVAHELNNPVAAAQRSASALAGELARVQDAQRLLAAGGVTPAQETVLTSLADQVMKRVAEPVVLDTLARTDREDEVESWLGSRQIDKGWELATDLVALDFAPPALEELAATFAGEKLAAIIIWLSATYTLQSLAKEIRDTMARVARIVGALKSYTYMDQAPVQQVDIHRGLEDTLTLLRQKLGERITVVREYAEGLPQIEAYGSELNQVWTNLIDNALAAMGDTGCLTLQTRREGEQVIVTVEDTGHGVPAEIQAKIFDPFFTTKPPGEGAGLGLNIAHNIIVQRHKGRIAVESHPGHTRFEVSLPLAA